MNDIYYLSLIYFAAVSLITAFITLYDKSAARKNKRRIPESTLLSMAIIGGAVSEYIVMRLIRHKTLHKKFMIGLPVIIFLHIALLSAIIYFSL